MTAIGSGWGAKPGSETRRTDIPPDLSRSSPTACVWLAESLSAARIGARAPPGRRTTRPLKLSPLSRKVPSAILATPWKLPPVSSVVTVLPGTTRCRPSPAIRMPVPSRPMSVGVVGSVATRLEEPLANRSSRLPGPSATSRLPSASTSTSTAPVAGTAAVGEPVAGTRVTPPASVTT